MRVIKEMSCAIVLLVAMAACGGGGSTDEPSEDTPAVDCAARPEACR